MARAKRTQRAEARRRYRDSIAATAPLDDAVDVADEPASTASVAPVAGRERPSRSTSGPSSRASSSPGPRASAPGERPSLLGGLRRAMGPADIRGDIQALPAIALHSKALIIPLAAVAASAVLAALPSMRTNAIVAMLVQLVLQPPPMIVAFLAGMLAPRGAWLVGGITSAVAGLAYVGVYASSLFGGETDAVTTLGWTRTLGQDEKTALLGSAILFALGFGLVFGIAIGAFAGFYRRFLAMSGPQRAPAKSAPSRPAPRRR